ncbi:DUF805 domain-containing protein [Novosphingobium sp.]|uniref:DUF805 domain-containing protein n=1 Tax=Novosphingobium sp. TaxID=1874826 RepID=UPI0035AE7C0D
MVRLDSHRLSRTIRASLDRSGRSDVAELAHYVFYVVLFHLAVGLVLMLALDAPTQAIARDVLLVVYFIPVPALMIRRLHDQERSAAWVWLAVPGIALWLARKVLALVPDTAMPFGIDQIVWPLDWFGGLANLVLIVLLLLPGTKGPNRFGPDPRAG